MSLFVLGGLAAVVSTLGYSLHRLVKRCLHELEATNAELQRIRAQLGTPQQAVYRLVATRATDDTREGHARIPDRPNPA